MPTRTFRLPDNPATPGLARYGYELDPADFETPQPPTIPGVHIWPLPSLPGLQRFGYEIDWREILEEQQ